MLVNVKSFSPVRPSFLSVIAIGLLAQNGSVKSGWGTRNRTWVHRTKICCLAPRRSPNQGDTLSGCPCSVKSLEEL